MTEVKQSLPLSLTDLLGVHARDFEASQFKAGAIYQPAMDWLLYLAEDVPYRVQPLIVGVVDILWHPYEDRIVGLKVWDASKHPAGAGILKTAGLIA